ncbi:MAG: asparagine synthase-related protein [Acidobacteriota bacterium]
MCGIAGVLRPGVELSDADVVRAMLGELQRRGPNGSGIIQDRGLTLGHQRLAILDLSPAGAQPMASASGRYLLSLNGEIYNHLELRDELGVKPEELLGTSDTEVLLHAWERWGAETPSHLVGQFAFAMWDALDGVLWLVRDRFGEKPLYWHRDGDVLAFASTIQALLKAPWIPKELSAETLPEYVALRYVVAPRTLLRGVRKVVAGHMLRIDRHGVDEKTWWDARFHYQDSPPVAASEDEIVERFGATFLRAATRCLQSDVPVALFLSDGIDSNGIRAALSAAGRPIPTYTYRMTDGTAPLLPIPKNGSDEAYDVVVIGRADRRDGAVALEAERTDRRRRRRRDVAPAKARAGARHGLPLRPRRRRGARRVPPQPGSLPPGIHEDALLDAARPHVGRLSPVHLRTGVAEREAAGAPAYAAPARARHRAVPDPQAPSRRRCTAPLRRRAQRLPRHDRSPVRRMPFRRGRPGPHRRGDDADLPRRQHPDLRRLDGRRPRDEAAPSFLDRDLVELVLRLPPEMRVSRWPGTANTKLVLRRWCEGKLPADVLERRKRSFNFETSR